jgi:hypothetical protein
MKSHLIAVALALVALALGLLARSDAVEATHAQYNPPWLMDHLHPDPGFIATYTTCTNDLGTHLLWAWGPEAWEDATNQEMNLDYVEAIGGGCTQYANTIFIFEYYLVCPPGASLMEGSTRTRHSQSELTAI